ncbi:repressor [Xanthomonas fragariae]|uniref:Repressor n=1 Tax=Xanthomonas fragariae TaxID=48664 RepID=A0A1Y6HJM5_9XANT|nr:hypothetical protein BER93_06880 [Xanthomonas fragariae]ENZ94795.1 repressor [Xanthomonas fragariae LMG 25863]SMQ99806.1 hypothetical protein PD885_02575 [Xanthomonas fragariae]SMR02741.1 repressor [Xanthomonas fragariae]
MVAGGSTRPKSTIQPSAPPHSTSTALEADGRGHCWQGLDAPSMSALAANLLLLDLLFEATALADARENPTQALDRLRAQFDRLSG